MADLTASDVTVTLGLGDVEHLGLGNKMVFPTVAFGDGADSYPAGGIPLPAIGYFDLLFAIRFAADVVKAGYVYHLDITNHKLMIYYGDYTNVADGVLVEFVGNPAATSIKMMLVGQ